MEINNAKPGSFCWFELATSDQAAAKKFYGGLFGWTANDNPMGPDAFYTMFQLRGRNVGAAYTLDSDQAKQGVPPHWGTYVAVTNVEILPPLDDLVVLSSFAFVENGDSVELCLSPADVAVVRALILWVVVAPSNRARPTR